MLRDSRFSLAGVLNGEDTNLRVVGGHFLTCGWGCKNDQLITKGKNITVMERRATTREREIKRINRREERICC